MPIEEKMVWGGGGLNFRISNKIDPKQHADTERESQWWASSAGHMTWGSSMICVAIWPEDCWCPAYLTQCHSVPYIVCEPAGPPGALSFFSWRSPSHSPPGVNTSSMCPWVRIYKDDWVAYTALSWINYGDAKQNIPEECWCWCGKHPSGWTLAALA